MKFTPSSWGAPLQEFNACHNLHDGRFAVKGQGRCLGVASRVAARQAFDRQVGYSAYHDSKALSNPRLKLPLPEDEVSYLLADLDNEFDVLEPRRDARAEVLENPLPRYLQKDLKTAKRTDAVVAHWSNDDVSDANTRTRVVRVAKVDDRGKRQQRSEVLSTLRHELGHIDRTPLGSGGLKVGGLPVSPLMAEEIRAWKNAIRNSRGRVSVREMRAALLTYLRNEDVVGVKFGFEPNNPTAQMEKLQRLTDADLDRHAVPLLDRHVMPVLTRYMRRIRRASRGLK